MKGPPCLTVIEMNEVTKRIESAPDHKSRKELARRLADAMDK